jgi:hypothetical protein
MDAMLRVVSVPQATPPKTRIPVVKGRSASASSSDGFSELGEDFDWGITILRNQGKDFCTIISMQLDGFTGYGTTTSRRYWRH